MIKWKKILSMNKQYFLLPEFSKLLDQLDAASNFSPHGKSNAWEKIGKLIQVELDKIAQNSVVFTDDYHFTLCIAYIQLFRYMCNKDVTKPLTPHGKTLLNPQRPTLQIRNIFFSRKNKDKKEADRFAVSMGSQLSKYPEIRFFFPKGMVRERTHNKEFSH
jgi:hypothetical protein